MHACNIMQVQLTQINKLHIQKMSCMILYMHHAYDNLHHHTMREVNLYEVKSTIFFFLSPYDIQS